MKKPSPISLVVLGISLIGFAYLIYVNKKQKEELVKKEKVILKLWDDKIAEYQFLVNVTYRDSEAMKDFFDNLDNCYDKLRKLLHGEILSNKDKNEIINFIMTDFTKNAGIKKVDVLSRLKVENSAQIFVGNNLEIVERLERLFNPNFMTKCIYFQDFDIWEKQEKWNLNEGDTTYLMIRLLKNYDLNSHQTELIPSKDLKVLKPYLGELRVIIPKGAKKDEEREISFQLYDWINQDTIIQKMYLNPK